MEGEEEDVQVVDIRRGNGGFGFNIKGTTQEGGVLQAINGRLYAPLQYVSAVDEGGAAYKAGLRRFDRILSVNGVDTQGANHTKVVELVLRGGGHLILRVLRVDIKEAARLQRLEEAIEEGKAKGNAVALVQVKSFEDVSNINGTYTIFKIYIKGEYRCSRRYSEFVDLNKDLKARFRWFNFPPLPPKKTNGLLKSSLDAKDLEERRIGLDQYLSKVFSAEDIFDSDITKKFLEGDPHIPAHLGAPVVRSEPDRRSTADTTKVARPTSSVASATASSSNSNGSKKPVPDEQDEEEEDARAAAAAAKQEQARQAKAAEAAKAKAAAAKLAAEESAEVKLKVLCANHRLLDVRATKATTVAELEHDIKEALGLGDFAKNVFGLFICPGEQSATIPDKNAFERKLEPTEKVLQQKGRLLFHRCLFTKAQEQFAEPDEVAIDLLFSQAVDDLERGRLIVVAAAENKLAALKEDGERIGFLKVARKLEGYATVQFPESTCDFPEEDTSVIVKINLKNLVLQTDEENKTEFPWDVVTEHKLSSDQKSVVITYTTDDDEKETINISTQHAAYLQRCIDRVFLEREWARAVLKGEEATSGNFFQCK